MAKLQLGPLTSQISGRVGSLLFRRTRFGPVVQKMHPVRSTTTEAELAARSRFRIATHSWSVMYDSVQASYTQLQRTANTGTPGPWVASMLGYLAGRDWHYTVVSHPSVHVTITHSHFDGDGLWVRVVKKPDPPFTNVIIFVFAYPETDFVARWYHPGYSGDQYILKVLPSDPKPDHVVVVPVDPLITGVTGQGDSRPIPYG